MGQPGGWQVEAASIVPGHGATFELGHGEQTIEAFLVNHHGTYHAWVNRCPHAGRPLDGRSDRFFSADGRYLVCSTHGAVFDPATGLCVEGPCPGARLEPLPVSRAGDLIVVSCP